MSPLSQRQIGLIGGSGLSEFDSLTPIKEHEISTPYGHPSAPILEARVGNETCFFLPRHGPGHRLLPHEINYRANIYALKSLDVHYLVSLSAVGSLREDRPPKTFVLVDQFIDWTRGQRERTFFGQGLVGHVSMANPVDKTLHANIVAVCQKQDWPCAKEGTYLCIEGPQFSTRAESRLYKSLKADVIGMTNLPEAALAKEAGMAYACVAMVTDYDCWREHYGTLDEILETMKHNNKATEKLLQTLVPHLAQNKFDFEKTNRHALLTDREGLSKSQQDILHVLFS